MLSGVTVKGESGLSCSRRAWRRRSRVAGVAADGRRFTDGEEAPPALNDGPGGGTAPGEGWGQPGCGIPGSGHGEQTPGRGNQPGPAEGGCEMVQRRVLTLDRS